MTGEAGHLREAVRLAAENGARGQQPFGALVVRGNEVLGTGVNTALADADPTAHAEVVAIRDACRRLLDFDLAGATVVSSCEPCPLCRAAAALVGIERILYAATAEDAARAGFVLPPAAAALAAAWRESPALRVEHVPTPGAEEPFVRPPKTP